MRRGVGDFRSVADPRVRARFGVLEGVISVVINLALAAVKAALGFAVGSVALLADAFHSASDVASSAVVIWGFKAAARPADARHPFGHGRLESVAALVIAVLLLVAAVEFGRSSVERLLTPRPVDASAWMLVVLGVTLVLKEWLARFSHGLARRLDSSALAADAWHHRSDALSTGAVIVALAADRFGWHWADGAAGLVVSLVLVWAGVSLIREAVNPLIGEAPEPVVLEQIRTTAMGFPGVDKVHDIIVHRYGTLLVTSLHIEVSGDMETMRAHELAENVERGITDRLGGWATVHVDPVNRDHPLYPAMEEFLAREVARTPGAASFHDLRIVGREDPWYVLFDLATDGEPAAEAAARLRAAVRQRFPEVAKVVINVESRFVY